MKRLWVMALIVVVALALGYPGYKALAGSSGTDEEVSVKALRSFQKETLPLRDQLAAKGLELRNEYAKASPDQTRIAALQKEMIDLRSKISNAAQKNGLSDWGPGWRTDRGYGGYGAMMGGYGPGYMMGQGYGRGYRGGYGCPAW